MQSKTKFTIDLLVFLILIIPVVSLAGSTPLVQCDTNCGFKEFMDLINRVIHFILFDMVIPISAIMFVYAGFLFVTSGGSSGARTRANSVFTNTVLGLIIAVAAFLIIKTVLYILGYSGSWIGFNPL
ncbi:MAG: hypothetical protein PHT16_03515 [Candidatus Pacebacteria bacterium]|nr:hypothetical protein [Candidatus Paceibacterota bacterium]